MLTRTDKLMLVAILASALFLRLVFFVGYANVDPWDDTLYLELARQARQGVLLEELEISTRALEQGQVTAPDTFILRRGAYLPVAASQALLGESEGSSAIPSLLASLATLCLVFWMGYRLLGREEGLLAACLFAVVPLDLVLSTRILADAPQAFWLTASVAAALEAAVGPSARPRRFFLYGLSALALYLAYFTRVNGLVGLPIVLVAAAPAFYRRTTRLEPLVLGAVLFALLLADALWFLHVTGHAFFLLELETAGARAMFLHNPEVVFELGALRLHLSYEEGVWHHFFKLFFGRVEHYEGLKLFSSFAPLGAAALVYAFVRNKLGLAVFWLLFIFFYVQYGFRSIEWDGDAGVLHYFLNAQRLRYLALLVPALCLLLALPLAHLWRKWRPVAVGGLLLVIGPALFRAQENHAFYRGSMSDLRVAARALSEAAPAPVYTDRWARQQLPLFAGGRNLDLHDVAAVESATPGSFVVVGGSRGADIPSDAVVTALPEWLREIYLDPSRAPSSWTRVLERPGPKLPSRQSNLAIFRIGTATRP